MLKSLKKEGAYFLFLVPALVSYTILTMIPLLQTFYLSFTDWDGYEMYGLNFVGLQNYITAMSDDDVITALLNTFFFSIVFPLIVTVLAIPLALALNSGMKTRNLQRALFFFPSVPSAMILGYLWAYILQPTANGALNQALGLFGIDPVLWLATPEWAMFSVIMVSVWSSLGWHACIYIARLQGIPADYYEAAKIDGANPFQRFRYITFPMLSSAMTISVMLLLLNSLKVFDLPFSLTKGGPGDSTTMISQLIIKMGFTEKTFGKATAFSIIFFICIAVISIIQLKAMKSREVDL